MFFYSLGTKFNYDLGLEKEMHCKLIHAIIFICKQSISFLTMEGVQLKG